MKKAGWTLIIVGILLGCWLRESAMSAFFLGAVPIFIGILLLQAHKNEGRKP
jgi:hypothetical protein